MKKEVEPISLNERIQSIDCMRGFAIFGIFLVNMLAFHSPVLYFDEKTWWKSPLDYYTSVFIDVFAQASFYTLFSFLFGFGMVLFKERFVQYERSFITVFTRRLIVLLLIGVIHAFLIWHGDILITYALFGFILLLFHKASPKALLIWASALLFIPSLLIGGMLFIASMLSPGEWSTLLENPEMVKSSLDVYSAGTYFSITKQRITDWAYVNANENIFFIFLSLFPMFLLGAYTAKKKWLVQVELHRKIFAVTAVVLFMMGVPLKVAPLFSENAGLLYIQDALGGPFTALFYICIIALISNNKALRKLIAPLSFVGRLSLSNYLLQSLVCTFVFYGYGLGLYGEVGAFTGTMLVFLLFSFQIIISRLWLKRYRLGPVEWLWRTFTYGKRQVLLREQHTRGKLK